MDEAEINLSKVLPAHVDIELVDGNPLTRIFNPMFAFVDLLYGKECKRDWIIGNLSGRCIVQKIKECIDEVHYASFFKSTQEKNLIKYGSEHILDPEKLVALTGLNPQGLAFVKKCKQSGLRILIISNWDPESFAAIKKKFPELFSLFNEQDIFIPADCGFIKPERELYNHVIAKANLAIGNTFFVDDSASNVAGAQQCGIISIVHSDWQKTEMELVSRGLRVSS